VRKLPSPCEGEGTGVRLTILFTEEIGNAKY